MLSFLESRSASYVLLREGRVSRPDENFARGTDFNYVFLCHSLIVLILLVLPLLIEIMQLFTIGLEKLNIDGTNILSENGEVIPTYENSDIQTFARAWTGFRRQYTRFNREGKLYSIYKKGKETKLFL